MNPGLWLFNAGVDFDITPQAAGDQQRQLPLFDKTNVLQQFLFQEGIDRYIGVDLCTGSSTGRC